MSQNNKPKNKIFCLEGEWHDTDLRDKSTVETVLRYLDETFDIQCVFRKVNSRGSLIKYLDNFKKYQKSKYKHFDLVYHAFHGDSKMIYFDKNESINLEELASLSAGSFSGRTVHFGSCRTLKVHKGDLMDFLKTSKQKQSVDFQKAWILWNPLFLIWPIYTSFPSMKEQATFLLG